MQRVRASILETLGDYQGAIEAYDRAIALAPNLTFLYIRAGVIYRHLGMISKTNDTAQPYYDKALEYFAKAVQLNTQLGIPDPVPYVSIGKVYTQMGEFFIARAMPNAPCSDPTGRISRSVGHGVLKAQYEARSKPQCAVEGCAPAHSCLVRESCPATPISPSRISAGGDATRDLLPVVPCWQSANQWCRDIISARSRVRQAKGSVKRR